jgi:Fe2+ or Zn2+ uptake regulation protein
VSEAENRFYQTVVKRLKARGGRMTRKRDQLLRALSTMDRPASAEAIREYSQLPKSDLVTVYRNLEAFESLGVLQRIPMENGTQLFELTSPDEHYHHLICRECHRTERLDLCVGREVTRKAKKLGFSQVAHLMEVYGICAECRSET